MQTLQNSNSQVPLSHVLVTDLLPLPQSLCVSTAAAAAAAATAAPAAADNATTY
jgi:hypothetical protein